MKRLETKLFNVGQFKKINTIEQQPLLKVLLLSPLL